MLRGFREKWREHAMSLSGGARVWVTLFLILVVLNAILYGGNLIRFGNFLPDMDQLLSTEQLMNAPDGARNYVVTHYLSGELNYDEALAVAEQIELPAARRDTQQLLQYYAARSDAGESFEAASRWQYGYHWLWSMVQSTYGVLAHEGMFKSRAGLMPYMILFLASLGILLTRWIRSPAPNQIYLFGIAAIYIVILMQLVGYGAYLMMQGPLVAVQGRYAFPVIAAMYSLVAISLMSFQNRGVRLMIFVAVALLFLEGDFVFYVRNAYPDFYFGLLETVLFL